MDADQFLSTLKKDVLNAAEYADVSGVSGEFAELLPVIQRLEAAGDKPNVDDFFATPPGRKIASLLLGLKLVI